jgi:hypothetical protein
MNRPCPRCGQNLIVHARGPARITCPVCLASVVTGSKPLPMPPLPVPVIPIPPPPDAGGAVPLAYHTLTGDVEHELSKDLRWSMYGIATFAGGTILGFIVLIVAFDAHDLKPAVWLSGVVVATGIVGAVVLARHGARREDVQRHGRVPVSSSGQRVIKLVALGFGGLVATGAMVFLAAVAMFILLILVCFGGLKL